MFGPQPRHRHHYQDHLWKTVFPMYLRRSLGLLHLVKTASPKSVTQFLVEVQEELWKCFVILKSTEYTYQYIPSKFAVSSYNCVVSSAAFLLINPPVQST